jgi:hypothetical protein
MKVWSVWHDDGEMDGALLMRLFSTEEAAREYKQQLHDEDCANMGDSSYPSEYYLDEIEVYK